MSVRRLLLIGGVLLALPAVSLAQHNRPYPYPVFLSPQFEQAVENGTRTLTGAPGPNYWTNTADYTIHVALAPSTNMLRGTETVRYHNHSPDELRNVVVHLHQNLHQPGVVRNRPQQVTGGMHVSHVAFGGETLVETQPGPQVKSGYFIQGTRMFILLPEPIPAGGSAEFAFSWSYEVPEAGAPRNGQDGEVFYMAYWYPQIAVYDDVSGWKADPYMGNGEFYMGYGNYDVEISVPEGWLVAATGDLQNPADVLSRQTQARLQEAAQARSTVNIVQANERRAGTSTAESDSGVLTWHFQAENVRDFAWGTSDQYLWDAASARVNEQGETAMIHALYRPEKAVWARAAEFGQFSVEYLSEMFMPYPYPHMTAVEGIIGGGMEYPMMTLIGGNRDDQSLFRVTLHEIAHMWFPMIVGQDEKQFTWMDEGLTSFNTAEGASVFWNEDRWEPRRQSYYFIAGTGQEVEPMRHGDRYPLDTPARGIASYNKPAVALHALRGLVGQERFLAAYREYARRWAYKHPQPYDLFNTFEDVLGEDLDWFWTSLFYETWTLDHAVKNVEQRSDAAIITIADLGLTPMPVPLRITYADGTVLEERIPVSEWLSDKTEVQLTLPAGTIERVEIDPEQFLPDVDRENNRWTR